MVFNQKIIQNYKIHIKYFHFWFKININLLCINMNYHHSFNFYNNKNVYMLKSEKILKCKKIT